MRVYDYGDRLKRRPFIINDRLKKSAFLCAVHPTVKLLDDLRAVAKATYLTYMEGFRIVNACMSKRLPKLVYSSTVQNSNYLLCDVTWLNDQLIKFTKNNPECDCLWTTTRAMIAPRVLYAEFFHAKKLVQNVGIVKMQKLYKDPMATHYNYLKEVHVAELGEFYEFDPDFWQIPVVFRPECVVNSTGRKSKSDTKGKGVAIFSDGTDNYIYFPKHKEPFHVTYTNLTSTNGFSESTSLCGAAIHPAGYITYKDGSLFFNVLSRDVEFHWLTTHNYQDILEPAVERLYLHDGIYAHMKNGIIIPNDKIPDEYRKRCGLE